MHRYILALLCLVASGASQNVPSADANVTFHVAVGGQQNQFHIGEKIPLELSYSSAVKDRYQINMATYDRSGRMEYEHFHVTPESGAVDPLAKPLGSMGGFTGFKFLDAQPWTIKLNLNEWIRFTKPGDYLLSIDSNRISVRDPAVQPGTSPSIVRSNEIRLKVIPASREWQAQVYKQAVTDLNQPDPHDRAQMGQNAKSKREALETLRFLGTPESIRELTKRMRGEDQGGLDYISMLGVAYSPLPDVARSAVAEALADPNHPITQDFLYAMRILTHQDREPGLNSEHWGEEQHQTLEQLIAALPRKTGKALSVSLYTAANEAWSVPNMPQATVDKLTEQLVSMFDQLSAQDQNMLLTYRWDKVANPKLVPLLRRVAQHYEDFPQMRQSDAYTALEVSGSALRHWYEVDPAGARPAVIAEITRPRPRYDARLLGMLPDKSLPEADSALAEHLRAAADLDGSENIASLIARYGSEAILPEILDQLDPHIGKCACTVQNRLLAYVLRVAPALARPRIEQAIATRGAGFTACYNSLFQEISEIHFDPVLEEIGIRSLDDPEAQVAMTAATMLGRVGSSSAEPALLERYQRWSQQWAGRESEFNVPFSQSSRDILNQLGIGQNLMTSLATGQHWLADEKKLEQLALMSKVSSIQNQMEQCLRAWQNQPFVIAFSHTPYDEFHGLVAQYALRSMEALEEKLAQFPSGTKFVLSTQSNTSSRELKETNEIREVLTSHGMEVVNQSGH